MSRHSSLHTFCNIAAEKEKVKVFAILSKIFHVLRGEAFDFDLNKQDN